MQADAIKLIKKIFDAFDSILSKDIKNFNGVKYVKYTDAKMNLNKIRTTVLKALQENNRE